MIELDCKAELVLRRFGGDCLTGKDLAAIRSSVLDITQEQLAIEWGISRTLVSRMESTPNPDQRTCDQYRGLLMRAFFFKNFAKGGDHDSLATRSRDGDQSLSGRQPAGEDAAQYAA
ncbi:XRE family transcriptional regulator [Burkholderia sp. Tr-20390]|uniref:XRE family transcriptional regulator n=1 Tax=Burkholderia sp. Tr-20390 TaxID=2703904 RepID=UPI00197CD3B1|nr:XRE family transcriptional regulator [Burkholderia sp. Tr-20390]MBN3729371.1 XRE family transcriptional regulator [Burkholderia sp. Tr-20390]